MPYRPRNPPTDKEDLGKYLQQELDAISAEMEIALARNVEFLNVVPKKLREGMIRGADGTNWNPGSGKGVYAYYSAAWHFLG